jgi:putative ABC transport system permease protein
MERLTEFLRRLRSIPQRGGVETGLDEEIRFHIEQQTAKNIRAGMPPDEARRQAFVRFGGVEHVKEQTRDEFRPALVEDLLRDLRYGLRMLWRAPAFAVIAVLTLALGIGAAAAVFSVVNGVLLRPLPYPDADRIVRLLQIDNTGRRNGTVSEPNFEDWKNGTRSFVAMAEMAAGPTPVGVGTETTMIPGAVVSREFFAVLGVQPASGRGFVAAEQAVGGVRAVVVGHDFWQQRLNGGALDGLTVRINDQLHQVVGVMPRGFDFPPGTQFWTPRELTVPQTARTAHNWQVVARVAPQTTVAAAQSEISVLSKGLKATYGDATWMSDAAAVPIREQMTAASRPVILTLFAAAVVLLVIACLNVSNLQLARASTRRREMAVRLAVGAGGGRLTRQLLAEALVLTSVAAIAGIGLAWAGVQLLVMLQPGSRADGVGAIPRVQDVHVDWTVLAFAVAVALGAAVLLGVATAFRASRQEIRSTLTEGTRSVAGGRAAERVRQGLVIAQVALTIVLLVGSGLLARSFAALLAVDPGYRTSDAVLLDLTWTFSREPAVQARRKDQQRELLEQLATIPGVERTGLVNAFPLGGGLFANGRFLEMTRADELQRPEDLAALGDELKARAGFANYRIASADYFAAMRIPLVRGRLFDDRDGPDAPHVAVISESLAAAKWPNQDPIGRFVQFGNMDGDLRGFRIVGIVGDVREVSPESVPGPTFYGSHRQRMAARYTVVLHTSRDAATVAPAAREIVRRIDPALAIQTRTLEDAFERALSGRRFSLSLIVVFSGVALLLATLGIYGLISYLVTERTKEIGIRLALGAASTDVIRLVVGQGVWLAAAGAAVGLASAFGLMRFVKGMLFGVTETDPVAFGGVLLVTLAAVMMASYVPARRALKVEPVTAMRGD